MTFHNLQNSLIYIVSKRRKQHYRDSVFQNFPGGKPRIPQRVLPPPTALVPPILNSSLRDCCTPSVIMWYRFFVTCFFACPPYYLPSNEVPPQFEKPGDATVYHTMKYESIAYDLITNQQVYYQSQIMTRSGATEVTQGNGSRIFHLYFDLYLYSAYAAHYVYSVFTYGRTRN